VEKRVCLKLELIVLEIDVVEILLNRLRGSVLSRSFASRFRLIRVVVIVVVRFAYDTQDKFRL
jgi:hypothetical protein